MEMAKSKRVFLKFTVGDVEDPDMYANMAIESWSKSTPLAYEYLMKHSDGNVTIKRTQSGTIDHDYYGHSYELSSEMEDSDWAYYFMRFYKDVP